MRAFFDSLFPQGAPRLRTGLGVALAMLSLFAFLLGGASDSAAATAEAIDLLATAALLLVDPLIAPMQGPRRLLALVVRQGTLLLMAMLIVLSVVYRCFVPADPAPEALALVAVLSLLANLTAYLLVQATESDVFLAAARPRARNEMLGGVALLVSAGLVMLTQSQAADLLVALVSVTIVVSANLPTLLQSMRGLNAARPNLVGKGNAEP